MSDFHQSGPITTLHRLGPPDRPRLEAALAGFAKARPLVVILPALASEMDGPALVPILEELAGAAYVSRVILSLGKAGKKELARMKGLLSVLPQPTLIVHNDGKRLARLLAELKGVGVAVAPEGKGRAVWLALGLALGLGDCRAAALHDMDIVGYDRELLGRLAYPVMSPDLACEFAKGYYARITHKMYGRATRLFVGPFLEALIALLGPMPYLEFLAVFRYPLAGEFALDLDLARKARLPGDWGLEVGVLGEMHRLVNPRRVCQVDLADTYEHKHQSLSSEDPNAGLNKMACEVARTVLACLAAEGAALSAGLLRSLLVSYERRAREFVERYAADAAINGLAFDRHEESQAVETFAQGLARAAEQFTSDPRGQSVMANWNRVTGAVPDFLARLVEAVEADNA